VKYEGKRPLRRPRRRKVSDIRKDLKEIVWEGFDRVDLAQDRCNCGDSCESGNEQSGYTKWGEFFE